MLIFKPFGIISLMVAIVFQNNQKPKNVTFLTAVSADKYFETSTKSVGTAKYSFKCTIGTILILALVLSLPSPSIYFDVSGKQASYNYLVGSLCFQLVVGGLIPFGILIFMNVALYKWFKECIETIRTNRGSITDESLDKNMFQTKLSIYISLIFIGSICLSWVPMIVMISTQDASTFDEYVQGRMARVGQFGVHWSINTVTISVAFLFYILNSSANFYVYMILSQQDEKRKRSFRLN